MEALVSFYEKELPYRDVHNKIATINVLKQRGLLEDAKNELVLLRKKEMSIAAHITLLDLEYSILPSLKANILEMIEEREHITKKKQEYINQILYQTAYTALENEFAKIYFGTENNIETRTKQYQLLLESKYLKTDKYAINVYNKSIRYKMLSNIYFGLKQKEDFYNISLEAWQFIQQHPLHHVLFLQIVFTYLQACQNIKDKEEEFKETIKYMDKYVKKYNGKNLAANWVYKKYVRMLEYLLINKQINLIEPLELLKNLQKALEQYKNEITLVRQNGLFHKAILFCLQENLPHIGIDYFNLWQNNYKKSPDNKYFVDIRIAEILLHLLMKSYRLADSKILNFRRYLQRSDMYDDNMKELLSLLKKITNKPNKVFYDDYKNYYEPLNLYKEVLKKDKFSSNSINIIVLEKWLLHYMPKTVNNH